ncbi:MAG: hypothetical protein Q4A02_02400, partial [Bacteroidales bacterium]|nr:hypothetical protein [Bacteroidales bacterium]
HVPSAHSFFKKTSILENTAKSLPTYFSRLLNALSQGDCHPHFSRRKLRAFIMFSYKRHSASFTLLEG